LLGLVTLVQGLILGTAQASSLKCAAKNYSEMVNKGIAMGTVANLIVGGGAAAAAVGGAAVTGTIAGQGIDDLISWFWDPSGTLMPLYPGTVFTSVTPSQIDAFISVLLNLTFTSAGVPPTAIPSDAVGAILNADSVVPNLGSATLDFLRIEIKTYVDAAQGAAAYTVGRSGEVQSSYQAVLLDLQNYIGAINGLASIIPSAQIPTAQGLRPLEGSNGILPSVTLADYQEFLTVANPPPGEVATVGALLKFSNVTSVGSINDELVAWLREGDTANEAGLFLVKPNSTLTFSEGLEGGVNTCWACLQAHLYQSDLLRAPPTGRGGLVVPIDMFGLLTPYIGLTLTTMIGAVATVVYVKRVKRRKEKQ
jgi:hypothetical protein